MEVCGSVWRCVEVCGGVRMWRCVEVVEVCGGCGGVWRLWRCVEVCMYVEVKVCGSIEGCRGV